MFYSCTHMATVGAKWLRRASLVLQRRKDADCCCYGSSLSYGTVQFERQHCSSLAFIRHGQNNLVGGGTKALLLRDKTNKLRQYSNYQAVCRSTLPVDCGCSMNNDSAQTVLKLVQQLRIKIAAVTCQNL